MLLGGGGGWSGSRGQGHVGEQPKVGFARWFFRGSGWGEIRIQRWGWTETARLMGRHGGSALVVGTLHGENAGTIAGTKSGGLVGYSTKCLKLHPLFF